MVRNPQEVFGTHGLCYQDGSGEWMYDSRVPCEHPEWHKEEL